VPETKLGAPPIGISLQHLSNGTKMEEVEEDQEVQTLMISEQYTLFKKQSPLLLRPSNVVLKLVETIESIGDDTIYGGKISKKIYSSINFMLA